jgi:hypothetical protein
MNASQLDAGSFWTIKDRALFAWSFHRGTIPTTTALVLRTTSDQMQHRKVHFIMDNGQIGWMLTEDFLDRFDWTKLE